MGNLLQDRLKAHSNAFNGLLSLIPAKYYYDQETSNQWQQTKKSKEELKSNKRKKLNPELAKDTNAQEVLNARAKDAKPVVLPGQKKIQQQHQQQPESEDDDSSIGYGSEELEPSDDEDNNGTVEKKDNDDDDESLLPDDASTIVFNDDGDVEGGQDPKEEEKQKQRKIQLQKAQKKSGKKELTEAEKKEKEERMAKLRAKLSEKIGTMKEKRKAPGTKVPGAATSREQILAERRKKQELRKELKRKREEENENEDSSSDEEDEDELDSKKVNGSSNGVIFGNIQFADGDRVTSDLSSTRKVGKKKGPANNDIKAHLKKIEREKSKVQGLDKEAKDKLEEKNKWTRALSNIQGVKVKDDEKLLKKALRRKEATKRRSEKEWSERKQFVADQIKGKQDRREENLRIRRENKGKSAKHQTKQLRSFKRGSGPIKPKRAGFEGRLKSGKAGRGGKK